MEQLVNEIWEHTQLLQYKQNQDVILSIIDSLDKGLLRVAEPQGEVWIVNEWIKKAILLYFRMKQMEKIEIGPFEYYDKIPLKKNFEKQGVRVVPPAVARYGSFLSKGVVMMPSYVNIGLMWEKKQWLIHGQLSVLVLR